MLPIVHIVEDPSTAEPHTGAFVCITMEEVPVSPLSRIDWAAQALEKNGGVRLPGVRSQSGVDQRFLLVFLADWYSKVSMEKHIYLTHEAAKILLPEMCRPQVPFALAEADAELRQLCVQSLGRSLNLGVT